MATDGQWQSETFDNGRDFQKARPPHPSSQPQPMQGAGMPDLYSRGPAGRDTSGYGATALFLRIAQILFTLIAIALMAATGQTPGDGSDYNNTDYTSSSDTPSSETLKFSTVTAYVGLLALNCIVFLYATVQMVLSFVNKAAKGSFISPATTVPAMLTFLFDSVLAYALIAAAAAGANSAAFLAGKGRACSGINMFCQKVQASVAMSFFAFFLLAMSVALYPVRLLKLTKG